MLAVAVVAAALCADRAAAATPTLRPQVGEMARQLAGRLTGAFRRAIPSARFHQDRQERPMVRVATPRRGPVVLGVVHRAELSELLLRLPPPLV